MVQVSSESYVGVLRFEAELFRKAELVSGDMVVVRPIIWSMRGTNALIVDDEDEWVKPERE